MLLNRHAFEQWDESDLRLLIDNPDYAENDKIDYKQDFDFLRCDPPVKQSKKNEFRHDVCAFANADGGYLFYGIKETGGIAKELIGIDIPQGNTDYFELARRNDLATIEPAVPNVQFHFVSIANRYMVILRIERGFFQPYVCREDEDKYKFFARRGNCKRPMSYSEVQSMFTKSAVLAKEIEGFRRQQLAKIGAEAKQKKQGIAIVHLIPSTFLEPSTYVEPFVLLKSGQVNYSHIFSYLRMRDISIPNVDGLLYPPGSYSYNGMQVFKNNIIEIHLPVETTRSLNPSKEYMPTKSIADDIRFSILGTIDYYKRLQTILQIYTCVSIIGCCGVMSEEKFKVAYVAEVDRDEVICEPICINNILDDTLVQDAIKKQLLVYCLALGIKNTEEICGK